MTETAALLGDMTDPLIVTGDIAYPNGTAAELAACYDPSYGKYKAHTYPVPGNHDYNTTDAADYFAYFGSRVGTIAEPWYSVSIGDWHFVMVNSNCASVGGCDTSSPQYIWLSNELATHTNQCVAAVWHHPRWSTGYHGNNTDVADMYALLVDRGVDLLLTGHDHNYERFTTINAGGVEASNGVREFVVGTGGASLRDFATTSPLSQARYKDSYGVLRLALSDTSYSWTFLPTGSTSFTDTGSDTC